MNSQESLNVLIQAVQIGQKAGAYDLKGAKLVAEAVEFFTEPKTEVKETEKEEPKKK